MEVRDVYLKCSNLDYDCELVVIKENGGIIYLDKAIEASSKILLLEVKRFEIIDNILYCVI